MPGPIPDAWKADVVRILKTEDEKHIEWTPPALQRWKSDTNGAWRYEAYSSILDSLSNDDIEGNETTSMPGQSATYEFLFQHGRIKMYGKIALLNDKLRILILSAHRAQRDSLRQ